MFCTYTIAEVNFKIGYLTRDIEGTEKHIDVMKEGMTEEEYKFLERIESPCDEEKAWIERNTLYVQTAKKYIKNLITKIKMI